MGTSLSPSIGSTTLTYQSQPQASNSNEIRLPSMDDFLRMTDRLSERNRTFAQVNSPPNNVQKSSEEYIDLTTDSASDPFNIPSFQRFSASNFDPTNFQEPNYLTILNMQQRTARRSRESTISREPPNKRRRANGSEEFRSSFSANPFTTSSRSTFKPEPVNLLEIPSSPQQESAQVNKTRKVGEEEVVPNVEDFNNVSEPQNEQDKQLADTIKAQAGLSQGTSKLSQITCIICMDNMENMTATICGHIFCYTCINEALIAGENRADGRPAPKCPMCRTKIRRKVTRGAPEIVPLTLKLMRRSDKAKGKQKEIL